MIPSTVPCELVTAAEVNRECGPMAMELYDRMDKDQRGAILWDLPGAADKRKALADVMERASLACFFMREDIILGGAWLVPTAPHSQTAAVHFAFAGASAYADKLIAGSRFLARALPYAELFIGMLPTHWRGAIRFAAELGFEHKLTLPKACWLGRFGRPCDCVLMAFAMETARERYREFM